MFAFEFAFETFAFKCVDMHLLTSLIDIDDKAYSPTERTHKKKYSIKIKLMAGQVSSWQKEYFLTD